MRAGPALWAAAFTAACAEPGVRLVCAQSGVLGKDGRCYDIVGDTADGEPAPGPGLPRVEGEDLRAAWDQEGLVAALAAAAAEGLPTPFAVTAGYTEIMAQGDAACPGDPVELDGRFLRGCTAASGAFFSGVSRWMPNEAPGALLRGVHGDFMLLDRAGRRLELGGGVTWSTDSMSASRMSIILSATTIWEGDPGALGSGISSALEGSLSRANGDLALDLQGSLAYSGYAFGFHGARIAASCAGAAGVVDVRDPSLGWHALDFGPACSPCAEWSYEGAAMGEVCVDLSPMVQPYADAWSTL